MPNLPSTLSRISAENHTNIIAVGRMGVGNARDGRVVEVVGVEWELQQVSDI